MNIEPGVVVNKAAQTAQYGGSAGAFIFGLTPSEWSVIGVIGGLVIAAIGFFVNWFYKHKHFKLAESKAMNSHHGWDPEIDE